MKLDTRPIVAAGFNDSTIKTWNWTRVSRQGENVKREPYTDDGFIEEHKNERSDYDTLIGHSGPVYGLSISSDKRWLLSCSEDTTTRLWNVETGTNMVHCKHTFL